MVKLTPSFLLEYEALDQEHQCLANIINQVVKAMDDGEAEKCGDLVVDLVQSAKSHFANEEALLVKIGYSNVKKHQDHHRSLNNKTDHMIEFAKTAGENQIARDSLRKEMVFFLMDDVITTDMDFKNFVAAFHKEVNRLNRDRELARDHGLKDLNGVSRKLDNLIEAIADGLGTPGLKSKLEELERRKQEA